MTRIALTLFAAVGVAVTLGAVPASDPFLQAQFRSVTDLVSVPVSVRSGSTFVKGLTDRDFVLLDNRVEQRVVRVDDEAVPIDVTLVIDTSGSTVGVIDQLKRDAAQMVSVLRPLDRVRLMAIDSYAVQVFPFQPATSALRFDGLPVNGLSSVHDAMAAAMLERTPVDRRHLIAVMTDGIDSISALGARAVVDIALRSDAMLNVFIVDTESAAIQQSTFQCMLMGRCSRPARYWIPYQDREFDLLRQAAESTGGEVRDQGIFQNRNAVGMFREAFDNYRQGYVLRYTPRGVTREGFHSIEVRLRGSRRASIRARRGYAIGPPLPGQPVRPALKPGEVLAAIPDLTAAYERQEFSRVNIGLAASKNLAALVKTFRAGGNPWPATPKREAVFLLELADAAMYSNQLGARSSAMEMLAWYRKLIRHPLEAEEFERWWYWGEIALHQGILDPAPSEAAISNALKRFPNEARFRLAYAIALDQRWMRGTHESPEDGAGPGMPASYEPERTLALYDDAAEFEKTRYESRVRQSYLLLRLGRHEDAVSRLELDGPPDQELLYLRDLFLGKALEAGNKFDQAEASYRAALTAWPTGQAARVALMTLAVRKGDREGAEALAETIEAQPRTSMDPYWRYWQADARFIPAIRERLRAMVR